MADINALFEEIKDGATRIGIRLSPEQETQLMELRDRVSVNFEALKVAPEEKKQPHVEALERDKEVLVRLIDESVPSFIGAMAKSKLEKSFELLIEEGLAAGKTEHRYEHNQNLQNVETSPTMGFMMMMVGFLSSNEALMEQGKEMLLGTGNDQRNKGQVRSDDVGLSDREKETIVEFKLVMDKVGAIMKEYDGKEQEVDGQLVPRDTTSPQNPSIESKRILGE